MQSLVRTQQGNAFFGETEISTEQVVNHTHHRYREETEATYVILTAEWTGSIHGTALQRESRELTMV